MATRLARQKATKNLIENLLPGVKFTEAPSESLNCIFCKKILRNPQQLSCGHRVCKPCEEASRADNSGPRYCPLEDEEIENVFPDMSALTEIMHLPCFCVSRDDGCEWQSLLLELEDHLKECEFGMLSDCPFVKFECGFKGNKKLIQKHLQDEVKKHDALVATCLKGLMDNFAENRGRMNDIKEKTTGIERAFAETKQETTVLQSILTKTANVLEGKDRIRSELKGEMTRFDELIKSSEQKRDDFNTFQKDFQDLQKNVEEQLKCAKEITDEGGENKMASTSKALVEKVKRLTTTNESQQTQMTDLGMKIRIYQNSSNDGTYVWKLDNLKKRIADLSNNVNELYTPPLYTSAFGYKYSAKLMMTGNGAEQCLSFYIVLMMGDYDEILVYPFPYPIKITLLNSKKNADITHTLYPDPNKLHFLKPYKNMNPAIGFAKFCRKDNLFSDGFVKNDSIYFEIIVDKSAGNVKEPNI